jgi:hypothetical protein
MPKYVIEINWKVEVDEDTEDLALERGYDKWVESGDYSLLAKATKKGKKK